MRLASLRVKNFRGLQEIDLNIAPSVVSAVIVGPNAVGKTTILEAIRLVRCLLMPTYNGEEQQALQALGILSPHTGLFSFDALGDPQLPLEIRLAIDLSEVEIQLLDQNISGLSQLHLRNTLGLPPGQPQLPLVQILSSPAGRAQLHGATEEIKKKLGDLKSNRRLAPTLIANAASQEVRGRDLLDQEILTFLFRSQLIGTDLLSYFPADRAMPSGEVGIQIGAPDAQAQQHSHMGQPATKYHRLKQYIVNQYVLSEGSRASLREDFELIFSKLLPGKSLQDLAINAAGTLSVRIREAGSNAIYDIDSMSSGEKGLLLTFLLLRRAIAPGGIVLIDEPELHLNPTVTRKVLPFLIEHILNPLSLQALICTHSPEVLGIAFERSDCALLHLRSGRDLSPILKKDKSEVFEAIKRLGAQTSDALFMRGCVYVEGRHDVELLEVGFAERVSSFKLSQLGGRQEVEKEIRSLLAAQAHKPLDSPQSFIFDLDGRPSGLQGKEDIRVEQWDRYCFENYLLDEDVIYDVLKDVKIAKRPESRTELKTTLREIAMGQLRGRVTRDIYAQFDFENPGLRPVEIDTPESYDLISEALAARLATIKAQTGPIDPAGWARTFSNSCAERHKKLAEEWNDKWQLYCDGKRVLAELQKRLEIGISLLDFKKRVVTLMAQEKTGTWRIADNILSEVVPPRP
jgi:predicted ATPase